MCVARGLASTWRDEKLTQTDGDGTYSKGGCKGGEAPLQTPQPAGGVGGVMSQREQSAILCLSWLRRVPDAKASATQVATYRKKRPDYDKIDFA